jgi:hypothetical protein
MYFQIKIILKYNRNCNHTSNLPWILLFQTKTCQIVSFLRVYTFYKHKRLLFKPKDTYSIIKLRFHLWYNCSFYHLILQHQMANTGSKTHYCGGLREREIKRHVEEHFSKFPWKYGHV